MEIGVLSEQVTSRLKLVHAKLLTSIPAGSQVATAVDSAL